MTSTNAPLMTASYDASVHRQQSGFALFTMMVIVIIVGVIAVSSLRLTELTEVLAGNSIQRGRAIQSAEGGLITGERSTEAMTEQRVFSTPSGESGLFARDSLEYQWWRNKDFTGATVAAAGNYPGVISPPSYVVEEIGSYVADGGSGVVSLDRGSASYGRKTGSGREIVLYKLQSVGVGSSASTKAVVESLFVRNQ